ncbi:restriction endonuclease subunit S [Roseomonas mucosa]|uniref:restriction endonuclease subunit S n=1 Tax=Roseomonas mucosa TaxID=207340 RepID=UPI0028CED998|nr:restriction endonuclease subunit S [Roseomonas mucosa]MDT8292125.1 restriction endonuclease subunit S [Roseomonas mucosa]
MSVRAYPAYRESGAEWLGAVPAAWSLLPLKYVTSFVNGEAFKPTEWTEQGVPIIRIQNLNGGEDFNYYDGKVDKRYHVQSGDLLFGWSGNRGTSFGPFIWRGLGLYYLNQHIFKVTPRFCDSSWLYWCLKSVTLRVEEQAHGIIGMVHVTKGELGGIQVPVPSLPEQSAIAAFLDRETGKIDALVAEQERLIALLKEKRQAVISQAVTKGLDPNVPMKDSGVEWLGEVPAHWKIQSLKHCVKFVSGGTPNKEREEYWQGDIPWVSPKDMKSWIVSGGSDGITPHAVEASKLTLLPVDSVLVVVRGMILAHSFPVAISVRQVTINQDMKALLPRTDVVASFLGWFLSANARAIFEWIDETGHGTRALRMEGFSCLPIAIPPLTEQVRIISHLEDALAKLDALASASSHTITLLRERRAALIAAAVTGKIDVRDNAATEQATAA